jgi:oligopeptide/dipeptide ABC transporter ATP-binding protein
VSPALLEVRELCIGSVDNGGVEPVASVSLVADRGEILGLVGESGSGKSLTLRAITGLLPSGLRVKSGSLTVAGKEVTACEPRELRHLRGGTIGMVFQEPMSALNPTMRVGAQIAESARQHLGLGRREARERAVELLRQVGLRDPEHRVADFPHQLSGGMRQRVMIAIALAAEPALLLCDEPTTALDATVKRQVLELLGQLAVELDLAIVLVTHDLGAVARVCSRVTVMYGGMVVEEGPADEVLRRPAHPYTLALLRAVPTRHAKMADLKPIPGSPPEPADRPPGCPFAPRCPLAEPRCSEPVALTKVQAEHSTACRRHEQLLPKEAARHG